MKTKIPLIALAVFSIVILLAQNNLPLVFAVSTISVTFITGTTTNVVTYSSAKGSDTNTAYIIGQNAGQAYAWKTAVNSQTILFNVTLTGSGSARAIEWNDDALFVYAVTNDKFYKLSQSLGISGSLASGTANIVQGLDYDSTNQIMYYCTNDGYGSINISSLVPTNLYSDAGTNAVLDCAFDITNGFAVLVGDEIGGTVNCEIITVSLNSHLQQSCFNNGASIPLYGVCVDDVGSNYWALSSSLAQVKKFTTALSNTATVTVGTTPRNCSISTDDTARRLYVANEGTDNVSIVDIDANVVITTPSVCDTVADRKLDTHRTSNQTYTFVTCNSNVNTVIIDDTVSQFGGGGTGGEPVCVDINPSPILVELLCFEDLDGDGIPDTTLEQVGVSQNVTESTGAILCQIGFSNCDDPNAETNGTGLILLIALIMLTTSIILIATYKTGHSLNDVWIPLALISFLDIGLGFILNWIPDLLFYTIVALIGAMLAFGIYKKFAGSGDSG